MEKTGKPLKKGSPLPGAVGDFDLSLALSTPELQVGKSWTADGRPLLEILAPGNADGARDERANLARCLSAKDAAVPEIQLTLASVEEVKGERIASITFAMEGSLSGPWEDSNLAIGSGRPGQAITSRSRRFRNYNVTGTVGWSLTHGRVLTLEAKDSFSIGQLSATGSRAASSEAPLGTRADDSLKSLDARGNVDDLRQQPLERLSPNARASSAASRRFYARDPTAGPRPAPGLGEPEADPCAKAQRQSWAELLQRTFAVDVLRCPTCGGRRHRVTTLTDPLVARRILEHLRLRAEPPPLAPDRPEPQLRFA